jgi:hypothetical protein
VLMARAISMETDIFCRSIVAAAVASPRLTLGPSLLRKAARLARWTATIPAFEDRPGLSGHSGRAGGADLGRVSVHGNRGRRALLWDVDR